MFEKSARLLLFYEIIFKMRVLKLIVLSCILSLGGVSAETVHNKVDRRLPSAWVWEVSGDERVLYLVGELHSFMGISDTDLDTQLGFDVYNRASEVFTETDVKKPNANKNAEKLSEKIDSATWQRIDDALTFLLDKTNFSSDKKEMLLKEGLKELDDQSAAIAFSSLLFFSYDAYALSSKVPPPVIRGLLLRLYQFDRLRGVNKKIQHLESDSVADDVWNETCNSNEISEAYIKEALSFFDFDKFWNTDKAQKLQNAFWDSNATSDDVFKIWLDSYPGSALTLKCNIIPRNSIWIEKILSLLRTKGEPVALFVGFAHVAGKNGLLEALKNEGFSKIRRIKSTHLN